jgi:MFS family permease
MSPALSSNTWKLSMLKVSKWFMLYMPYIIPFYQSNGLEMHDIMILQAVYSVAVLVLEIPSGYLADVIGRKKTLVLGSVLGFLGFAGYSLSYTFWGFLIAEIILGFGQSFVSGADTALLYDTLLDTGKQNRYMKYEGQMVSIGNVSEALAGLAGTALAAISLRMNYYVQSGIAFAAIPITLTLVEPAVHKQMKILKFKTILQIVHYSLIRNGKLRQNIVFSSIIGASTLTMAWFVQPYFQEVSLPLPLFGIFWTMLNVTVGAAAFTAHLFERKLGFRLTIILIAVLIPSGYLLAGRIQSLAGISILFFFYFIRGMATPVLKDYINRDTGSEIRATVLSVRNMIIRLTFILVGPAMGWLMDHYGLSTSLYCGGSVFMVFAILMALFIVLFRKDLVSEPFQIVRSNSS